MNERGAYRQMAGRRPRREYDPFYDFGSDVDAALEQQAIRKANREAAGRAANGIPRDGQINETKPTVQNGPEAQ
jgi:hypothetical protein